MNKNVKTFILTTVLLLSVFTFACILTTSENKNNQNYNVPIHNTSTSNYSANKDTSIKFNSGGLGLDRKEWEELQGMEHLKINSNNVYRFEENQIEEVKVEFSSNLRIKRIESQESGVPHYNEIFTNFRKFIPVDSKCKNISTSETFGLNTVKTVAHCSSESLKSRFTETDFEKGNIGEFTLVYKTDTLNKWTTSFIIQIGRN